MDKEEITYYIWPRNTAFGNDISKIIENLIDRGLNFEYEDYPIFRIEKDKYTTRTTNKIEEFVKIADSPSTFEGFYFTTHTMTNEKKQNIDIDF
jgi:hypothetical protein